MLCVPKMQWTLVISFLFYLPATGRVSTLAATGNPHVPPACAADAAGTCECPAQRLDLAPGNMVPFVPVQADSFISTEEHEVQGLKVRLLQSL